MTAPSVQPQLTQRAHGLAREDTPWRRMADEQLAAKISEARGRVFIGFKNAGATAGVDARGRVLVDRSAVASGKAHLRASGVEITYEFLDMPTVVAEMPASALVGLRRHPLIEYIEPIFPGTRLAQVTPWNVTRVGAPAAWPSSTGAGAKLLIIDSGIQNTHPDLVPAVTQTCMAADNGVDTYGHGTAVAGIAAAVNNTAQIVGVSHGVALWSAKDGNATPDPARTACGVQFGRTNGVAAINISSSMGAYTALTDQINAAYYQEGIVVVVAAGNTSGGSVTYPASLDAAIAVSATDTTNARATFSAAGAKVEIAAPGTTVSGVRGLTSTCLNGTACATFGGAPLQGTSFAAPHVAAAAALLKAYNPAWTASDIRARLQVSARDLGAAGRDVYFGYGLLDIPAAIAGAPALGVTLSGTSTVKVEGGYTWTCAATGGTGSYSYQWTRTDAWGSYQVGTGPSYSSYVTSGDEPYFTLECAVTSGAQTRNDTRKVAVMIP